MIAVSSNRAPDIHELPGAIRILGPELHEPKQPDVVTVASRPRARIPFRRARTTSRPPRLPQDTVVAPLRRLVQQVSSIDAHAPLMAGRKMIVTGLSSGRGFVGRYIETVADLYYTEGSEKGIAFRAGRLVR